MKLLKKKKICLKITDSAIPILIQLNFLMRPLFQSTKCKEHLGTRFCPIQSTAIFSDTSELLLMIGTVWFKMDCKMKHVSHIEPVNGFRMKIEITHVRLLKAKYLIGRFKKGLNNLILSWSCLIWLSFLIKLSMTLKTSNLDGKRNSKA